MPNPFGKTRPASNPYEVWKSGDWEWHVLKKYKSPQAESRDPFARWFCLVKSPIVPNGELGDVYAREVQTTAYKVVQE